MMYGSIPYHGKDIYRIVTKGRESQVVHWNRCQKETTLAEPGRAEKLSEPARLQQPTMQQEQDHWAAHLTSPFPSFFGP